MPTTKKRKSAKKTAAKRTRKPKPDAVLAKLDALQKRLDKLDDAIEEAKGLIVIYGN